MSEVFPMFGQDLSNL